MNIYAMLNETVNDNAWRTLPNDVQYKIIDEERFRFILFQGTWSYVDCWIDIQNFIPNPKKDWFGIGYTKALSGYGLETLLDDIEAGLFAGKKVTICGWSLGGGYAQYLYAIAVRRFDPLLREKINCVAFGSPRVVPLGYKFPEGTNEIVHIVKRADGFIRSGYPGFKRTGAIFYIGKRGWWRVSNHDCGKYLDDLHVGAMEVLYKY